MRKTYLPILLLVSALYPASESVFAKGHVIGGPKQDVMEWRENTCSVFAEEISKALEQEAANTTEQAELVASTICNNITDYVINSGVRGSYEYEDQIKNIVATAEEKNVSNLELISKYKEIIVIAELCYYPHESIKNISASSGVFRKDIVEKSRIEHVANCNSATRAPLESKIAQIEESNRKAAAKKAAKIKAEELEAKKKADALAKLNKIAEEKNRKEEEFNSAMDMGEQSDYVVVWDSVSDLNMDIGSMSYKVEAINEQRNKGADQLEHFNMVMWGSAEAVMGKTYGYRDTSPPVYSEPKIAKGEFEKTSEFNTRKEQEIELAKKEHAKDLASHEKYISEVAVKLEDPEIKQSFFLDGLRYWMKVLLGENARTVKYDADNERFDVKIDSEGLKGYSVEAKLEVPVDEARSIKAELKNGDLHVLYQLSDSKLKIQRVVLRTEIKSYLITDVSDNLGDFEFTLEAANAYRPIYLAALKAEEEAKKQAIAESERKRKEKEKSKLVADEQSELERIKNAGNIAGTLGHEIAENTKLFVLTDNFGENPTCVVSIQAFDPEIGLIHPNFNLRVQVGHGGKTVWTTNMLSKTAGEVRLIIGGHRYSLGRKLDNDGARGTNLSSTIVSDLLKARNAKAISGKLGNSSLSNTYDLTSFKKAYKYANAVCS